MFSVSLTLLHWIHHKVFLALFQKYLLNPSSSLHFYYITTVSGKEPSCQCRRCGFDPWIRKNPWRRKWQPILVFLPRKSHGQRSLEGYSPWGRKRVKHDLATKQQQQNHTFGTLLCLIFTTAVNHGDYNHHSTCEATRANEG